MGHFGRAKTSFGLIVLVLVGKVEGWSVSASNRCLPLCGTIVFRTHDGPKKHTKYYPMFPIGVWFWLCSPVVASGLVILIDFQGETPRACSIFGLKRCVRRWGGSSIPCRAALAVAVAADVC